MGKHRFGRFQVCAATLIAGAFCVPASAEVRIVSAAGTVTIRDDPIARPALKNDVVAPGVWVESGAKSSFVVSDDGRTTRFGAHKTFVSPGVAERPLTWTNALSRLWGMLLSDLPGTPIPVYVATIIGLLLMPIWFCSQAKLASRRSGPAYNWH